MADNHQGARGAEPERSDSTSKPYYVVPMFPYPSGRLHMGHVRNYAISDAFARHAKDMGREVLHPIGWDSFGLPAEKAALSYGVDPKEWTESNIADMRVQLKALDFAFDWDRELATHEPDYYKHTQALFCALMSAGLVEKRQAEVWWDPVDKTVLANEQVVGGMGWRSGAPAEKRMRSMYWIRTTRYSAELAAEPLAWSAGAKADHHAWIGFDPETGQARLRDWCVSRQRAWGTPVPAVECPDCGPLPMPDAWLPHRHEDLGASCDCPRCGGAASKSSETLDTFFDSAWYFLRYPEIGAPSAEQAPFGAQAARWAPVDMYVGGREHATMHLLYARFLSRALADAGMPCPREPFARYVSQGMVKSRAYSATDERGVKEWIPPSRVSERDGGLFCDDGRAVFDEGILKMSKSKMNGVDPQSAIDEHGADAVKLCLFFAAPFEFDMVWDPRAVAACSKFAKRFAALGGQLAAEAGNGSPAGDEALGEQQKALNAYARGQFERGEGLNGLVAAIMKRTTEISDSKASAGARRQAYAETCRVLSPIAPGLAKACGRCVEPDWTSAWSSRMLAPPRSDSASVAVQFQGKFVQSVAMPRGIAMTEAIALALEASSAFREKYEKAMASGEKPEAVWVPGRALNAVVGKKPR